MIETPIDKPVADNAWRLCPRRLREDDDALATAVVDEHKILYRRQFADELLDDTYNRQLPIQIRAFRHSGPWRIFLLLTPWMLTRFFIPEKDPGIAVPAGWSAVERSVAPYLVMGPAVEFNLLTGNQKAHLNYSPGWGHYLTHPLVFAMAQYDSPEVVFEAWSEVIKTRDDNMKRLENQCQWQQDVSRREFFSRFQGKDK